MLEETVRRLSPFVPAKNFEESTKFYLALGFKCPQRDKDVRTLTMGDFRFMLRDHYVEDWANNFMINLDVSDIDLWHHHITVHNVIQRFPGTKVSKPVKEDWATIMHLLDPAGVLWHITEMS